MLLICLTFRQEFVGHALEYYMLVFWINLPRFVAIILCYSIYRLHAPKPSMRQQEKKNNVELMQRKGDKSFGYILSFVLRDFDLNFSDIMLPTFAKLVNVSLTSAKSGREFHTPDACVNFKSRGVPSDRKLIIVLQLIRRLDCTGIPLSC